MMIRRIHTTLIVSLCAASLGSVSSTTTAQDDLILQRDALTVRPNRSAGAELSPLEVTIWNSPSFQRRFTESYIAVTDVEPRVSQDEAAVMQDVMANYAEKNIDGAERVILEYLSTASKPSAVFEFTLGNIEFERENFEEAKKHYNAAIETFIKYRRAYQNLALIQVQESDFTSAIESLTRVIELGGGDRQMFGLLGICHSAESNLLAAESAYRMAMLLDPSSAEWKQRLAQNFFRQQRYSEAVTLLDELIRTMPDNPSLWLLQGNGYLGLGQALRAAENFEVVDRLGGSTPESLETLGDIYVNEQAYGLASRAYLKAIDLRTDGSLQRPMRNVRVLASRSALDEAQSLVDRIEESRGADLTDEQKRELYRMRARISMEQGASDEHVSILEEIVALDPLDGDALILLGDHAASKGDLAKASFYYEQAAGIQAFAVDAKIQHAKMLVRNDQFTEALPLLKSAQQERPNDAVQRFIEDIERRVR